MNPYTNPILHFLFDWQTLITGFFALVAGVGTIAVTRSSATKEVDAAMAQTKATREALITTQRAFVFVEDFDAEDYAYSFQPPGFTRYVIKPRWVNKGATPTKRMTIKTNGT